MVDLVLKDAREQSPCLYLDLFSHLVIAADDDLLRARHFAPLSGDAQASFLEGDSALSIFSIFGLNTA